MANEKSVLLALVLLDCSKGGCNDVEYKGRQRSVVKRSAWKEHRINMEFGEVRLFAGKV